MSNHSEALEFLTQSQAVLNTLVVDSYTGEVIQFIPGKTILHDTEPHVDAKYCTGDIDTLNSNEIIGWKHAIDASVHPAATILDTKHKANRRRKHLKKFMQSDMLVTTSVGTFDFTETSKSDFGIKVGSFMSTEDTIPWYDNDNILHILTYNQALEIVASVTAYRYAVKFASEADRTNILDDDDFSMSNLTSIQRPYVYTP